MKIDIRLNWSDEDIRLFPILSNHPSIVMVDLDYIDDEDDLIVAIMDKVYQKWNYVINPTKNIRTFVTNFDEVLGMI